MMRQMMHDCCGPDGRPDFDKMRAFMEREDRASLFDIIGWSLFFIWVGFAWLMEFSLGVGLLGVAGVTLGVQLARRVSRVKVEWFWIVVGLAFLVGGFWELWDVAIPLVPVVLIAVGVALLIWQFARKESEAK